MSTIDQTFQRSKLRTKMATFVAGMSMIEICCLELLAYEISITYTSL